MAQNGFDILLKMIQDTNNNVRDLTKLTAENSIAIKVLGGLAIVVLTGLITFYFTKIGGK